MNDQKNDLKEITLLWGELCDLQTRFACALKNAHFLFSWYTECSNARATPRRIEAATDAAMMETAILSE